MKYNRELFEISNVLDKIEEKSIIEEKPYEKELLKILIKKCKESNYLEYDNYIILTFNYPMFGNPEKGYNLIYSLVKNNKFNEIANEYGFYLNNINLNHSDYTDDNIEILWDYKSYNESIKLLKLQNTNNS